MENIPLGFWLYALGMLSGWCSMLVPCWLALRWSTQHEISAGSVHVKSSSYGRAQTLFLAAFEAHMRSGRQAPPRFGPLPPEFGGPTPPDQGSSGRRPGGGFQPIAGARPPAPQAQPRAKRKESPND